MTATTTERDAALARLREVVKPGDTLYVALRGKTRSGVMRVRFYVSPPLARITAEVADLLSLHVIPQTGCVKLYGLPTCALTGVTDRLSEALFGEPGQLKGEYL